MQRWSPVVLLAVWLVGGVPASAAGISGYWLTPSDHHHGAIIRTPADG